MERARSRLHELHIVVCVIQRVLHALLLRPVLIVTQLVAMCTQLCVRSNHQIGNRNEAAVEPVLPHPPVWTSALDCTKLCLTLSSIAATCGDNMLAMLTA
ncbi:MAG: hypothetical protein DME58_07880 [Verrucomicrobia bacterium]|nr:MAG: hypothetical protein DME58_07880 [Verrucomicrobiota bacterium]